MSTQLGNSLCAWKARGFVFKLTRLSCVPLATVQVTEMCRKCRQDTFKMVSAAAEAEAAPGLPLSLTRRTPSGRRSRNGLRAPVRPDRTRDGPAPARLPRELPGTMRCLMEQAAPCGHFSRKVSCPQLDGGPASCRERCQLTGKAKRQ